MQFNNFLNCVIQEISDWEIKRLFVRNPQISFCEKIYLSLEMRSASYSQARDKSIDPC